FAGPVAAEKTVDLPFRNGERQPIERKSPPIAHTEIIEPDGELHTPGWYLQRKYMCRSGWTATAARQIRIDSISASIYPASFQDTPSEAKATVGTLFARFTPHRETRYDDGQHYRGLKARANA